MRYKLFFLFFIGCGLQAGTFDAYNWRVGYKLGADEYQATLKIEYTYKVAGDYESALALPRDSNLAVFKLQFVVDGKKVDPILEERVTYWSNGLKVPVYMPPPGEKKVTAEALFTLHNLFVIPAAPCGFTLPCKSLEVGFSAIPGFLFGAVFTDQTQKFKRSRIAALAGGPNSVNSFTLKNTPASEKVTLFYLFPKIFQFSFANLTAAKDLGGSEDADSRAATNKATSMEGTLKPYAMVFYREEPTRDWAYVPTWIQQENVYLPFGIEPGGGTKTRSLFLGANDDRSDLLTWRAATSSIGDEDLPTEMDTEFDGMLPAIEKLRSQFSAKVNVNPLLNRLIAFEEKNTLSPAAANLQFATELAKRLKVNAVPAFITNARADLLGRLPLGGFAAVVTAFQVKDEWYFIDAADASWTLQNSFEHLTGMNVVILDGDKLRVASF